MLAELFENGGQLAWLQGQLKRASSCPWYDSLSPSLPPLRALSLSRTLLLALPPPAGPITQVTHTQILIARARSLSVSLIELDRRLPTPYPSCTYRAGGYYRSWINSVPGKNILNSALIEPQ